MEDTLRQRVVRLILDNEHRTAYGVADEILAALGLDDLDAAVERAIRAAYDAFPQYQGKRGTDSWRPKTYEECYDHGPMDDQSDVAEMRVALAAALLATDAKGNTDGD